MYRSSLLLLLLALLFTTTALTSCGRGTGAAYEQASSIKKESPMAASRSGAALAEVAADSSMAPQEQAQEQEPSPQAGEVERKLVTRGSMELVVDDLDKAEDSIRREVEKRGGYVSSMQRWGDGFSLTAKVPAEAFDSFVEESSGLGNLRSKNIDVQDVSERYYDLEHRIRNKEALVERFRSYLEEAEKIEEILQVERELSETVTELEQLEGSFRNLSHLVSFSTLQLSVRLPSYASDYGPLPSLREGLKEFGYTVIEVFYTILFVVLGLVVFGIPLILLIGLLYWIGFGKVGVIRRFFRRLRPKKSGAGEPGHEVE